MLRIVPAIFVTSLCLLAVPSVAQDVPDLTGEWTGSVTGGVRFGGGDLAPADVTPTFVHPEGRAEYTLTIAEQDGRGLMGTWGSISGSEAVQGVIRLDNTELLFVDGDSFFQGRLISATEMELCNQTIGPDKLFSLCVILKKQ